MIRRTASLPLHDGKAPRWLFTRMASLSREVIALLVTEHGAEGFLEKISDPFWFQAFGCLLGFDWHSSGVTTTVCGAIKEGIKGMEGELGLFVAGGKGKAALKTPGEIQELGEKFSLPAQLEDLVYCSRMAAKIDNHALQDGYSLYHHFFLFTRSGEWAVVQQGMNPEDRYARRYHWLSRNLQDLVCEPHQAICCDATHAVLNFVAKESHGARKAMESLIKERPDFLMGELKKGADLTLPARHEIRPEDLGAGSLAEESQGSGVGFHESLSIPSIRLNSSAAKPDRKQFTSQSALMKVLTQLHENLPPSFEGILAMRGVGGKSLRALGLLARLLYGAHVSVRDPVRFSFAHGGKDGHPYPVDRETYDQTIEFLQSAVTQTRIGFSEKAHALKRLAKL